MPEARNRWEGEGSFSRFDLICISSLYLFRWYDSDLLIHQKWVKEQVNLCNILGFFSSCCISWILCSFLKNVREKLVQVDIWGAEIEDWEQFWTCFDWATKSVIQGSCIRITIPPVEAKLEFSSEPFLGFCVRTAKVHIVVKGNLPSAELAPREGWKKCGLFKLYNYVLCSFVTSRKSKSSCSLFRGWMINGRLAFGCKRLCRFYWLFFLQRKKPNPSKASGSAACACCAWCEWADSDHCWALIWTESNYFCWAEVASSLILTLHFCLT